MISAFDETMLRRALRVAMNGRGRVEPNPMVGCVLVKHDRIIAEGHHTHFGGPHAEPTALADCQARGNDPRGATAYVTLEPCCHTNKKTPPCAPKLIEAGIARVVIGCLDPNPDVDGKGVAMLRAAGITVDAAPPVLASEFDQLITPFRGTGDAYITVKWAESANGKIAGANGHPVRITSAAADAAVHRLRTRCHGIAVGVNTILNDDPLLTVRNVPVLHRPIRIVIDRQLRTPADCRLLTDRTESMVRILCNEGSIERHASRYDALTSKGADIDDSLDPADDSGRSMLAAPTFAELDRRHVLIEAGPTLARSILPWADRLWVFRSHSRLPSGPAVPRSAEVPASYVETGRCTFGPDTLIEYLNRDAERFAAAVPSADFVLELEEHERHGLDADGSTRR